MFLRIVRVRSTEQSGIIGVKIPFDPNLITMMPQIKKREIFPGHQHNHDRNMGGNTYALNWNYRSNE